MSSGIHYTPIRIGRSDASATIKSTKHGRETNYPSADQLDALANPDDHFVELAPDHPIALEWKRTLGAMLQQEHAGQPKKTDQKWFLVFFPENYRLYQHVTSSASRKVTASSSSSSKGKASKGGENGTGGGEAYLYGYPLGRKKRYKSAIDFFPHLMWLAEDKSEDYADCTCKHCAPEWVQTVEPLPGREGFLPASGSGSGTGSRKDPTSSKKEGSAAKKESTTAVKRDHPAQVKRETSIPKPQVVIKNRPTAVDRAPAKPPTKTPPPPPSSTAAARPPSAVVPAPTGPTPTPLPAARSEEQATDARYQVYIYRPGEVTWFNRGTAWGLSVIISRFMHKDAHGLDKPRYVVQPLSHPFHHPPVKELESEGDLRPWLAWSAPGATHPSLAQNIQNTYTSIDWKAVVEGRYGPGDAEVDGSIYAAKMIDDSFTLLDPLRNDTTTTGERSYSAMFLGGEKLWVGEPVRLRINGGGDVMVVGKIVEKLKPGSTNIALASVLVVGDVFRFISLAITQPGAEAAAQANQTHLPVRMREDLGFRNRISTPKKRVVGHWRLVQAGHKASIADIKGRWYESSVLLPILHGPEQFAMEIARGEVSDVGNWINGREDANLAGGRVGTRIRDRVEALGKAVPEGTKIGAESTLSVRREGDSGPPVSAAAAAIASSAPSGGSGGNGGSGVEMGIGGDGRQVTGVSDGDIAEFMDLDRMEDGFASNLVQGGGAQV